jgi:S-formylglutathione hydrolase
MMKKSIPLLCISALGLLIIAFAGCAATPAPPPDRPQLVPGVVMRDVRFFSAALQRQMPYRVFLPAVISSGQKLPVVYLLHGGNGGFRDWSNNSEVAEFAATARYGGLILVMPEGAFSYYQNAAMKPDDKYENYLVNDLISDVENRFPAAAGRQNRAIIGISMGGFAAIKLALTRPELFAFVGAISPAIDVCERRFSIKRTGEWWRLRTIFGPVGSKPRHDADPFVLVQSADPANTPYLYLTAGEREALLAPGRRFAARLKQRGFSSEFHTKPGGHDWGEWNSQLSGCFESLHQHLSPTQLLHSALP